MRPAVICGALAHVFFQINSWVGMVLLTVVVVDLYWV